MKPITDDLPFPWLSYMQEVYLATKMTIICDLTFIQSQPLTWHNQVNTETSCTICKEWSACPKWRVYSYALWIFETELCRNLRWMALFSSDADPTMIYSQAWTSARTDLHVCVRQKESDQVKIYWSEWVSDWTRGHKYEWVRDWNERPCVNAKLECNCEWARKNKRKSNS